MCEAITLAAMSLAVTVAAAGAQVVQDTIKENQQQKAEDRNFLAQSKAKILADEERNRGMVEKKNRTALAAMKAQAELKVAGSESGLTGYSFDLLDQESMFNEGTDIASIEANRQSQNKQAKLESEKLSIDSKNRRSSIKAPNYIGAGLSIAGAGIDYGTTRNKIKSGAAVSASSIMG